MSHEKMIERLNVFNNDVSLGTTLKVLHCSEDEKTPKLLKWCWYHHVLHVRHVKKLATLILGGHWNYIYIYMETYV